MFPHYYRILPKCLSYLIISDWYDWELQITGYRQREYWGTTPCALPLPSDKRDIPVVTSSQTRRKRAASRGAAKAGQGAAITPPDRTAPTIAAHAGNSDVPATATCRRHLLCGNPSTWPKQSYGVCSNIKVDNVHNPTLGAIQRMQTYVCSLRPRRHRLSVYIRDANTECLRAGEHISLRWQTL